MKARYASRVTLGIFLLFGLAVGSPVLGSSRIENVTQRAYSQAEQAVTINRAHPNQIFIATNGRGGSGDQTYLVFARSTDGGQRWLRGTVATGSDGLPAACCDPSLTSDRFGNVYLAYLANSTLTPDQSLGLTDKTRPEEDHASRQFNPAQEPFSRPIQPAANPTKLSEEIVTPFHRLANLANPGLSLASRGGLQAEACHLSPLPGGPIAIGPISLGRG